MEMTRQINVNMDDELHREFGVECAKRDVTKSEVVRECVRGWLDADTDE